MDNLAYGSQEEYQISDVENAHTPSSNTVSRVQLPADVLLEIFSINANMDEDSRADDDAPREREACAINTARYSSQVSSLWRELIINVSTIWANLIDLDSLRHARVQWRELVIRRAQNCLLRVKGTIFLKDLECSTDPWWLDFIESNWSRIRQLDFYVRPDLERYTYTHRQATEYREKLSFLGRPTTTLESVCIRFADIINLGFTLFNNSAPRLRHFESKDFWFAHDSAWLLQLHTLHLHRYNWHTFASVDALYQLLSRMERLEVLSLDDCVNIDPDMVPGRLLRLPRLKYFRFHHVGEVLGYQPPRSVCWPLMNCLIPGRGCSIRVLTPDSPLLEDTDCSNIWRLARNYFRIHRPKSLTLSLTKLCLTFCDVGTKDFYDTMVERKTTRLSKAPSPSFAFFLEFKPDTPIKVLDKRVNRLIKQIPSSIFSGVADLYLTIDPVYKRCFTDRHFCKTLSASTTLKRLVTDTHTFYRLLNSPMLDLGALFPLLSVLEITVESLVPLRDLLVPFLLRRTDAGVPISVFEYHCLMYSQDICILDDFSCLESITGLEVVWWLSGVEMGQYVCGTGTPQKLNFRKKWAREEGLRIMDDEDGSGYLTDDIE